MTNSLFTLTLLVLLGCKSTQQISGIPGAMTFKSILKYDYFNGIEKKMHSYENSFFITREGNVNIYQVPSQHFEVSAEKRGDLIIFGERILNKTIFYNYYVFSDSSSYGIKYDSTGLPSAREFSVDSFLADKVYRPELFYNQNIKLVSVSEANEEKMVCRKYVTQNKIDSTWSDSTYLYFSKSMSKIPFTLSKDLDNGEMKFVKMEAVYLPEFKNYMAYTIPRRVLLIALEPAESPVKNELPAIIRHFKQHIGLIKKDVPQRKN